MPLRGLSEIEATTRGARVQPHSGALKCELARLKIVNGSGHGVEVDAETDAITPASELAVGHLEDAHAGLLEGALD